MTLYRLYQIQYFCSLDLCFIKKKTEMLCFWEARLINDKNNYHCLMKRLLYTFILVFWWVHKYEDMMIQFYLFNFTNTRKSNKTVSVSESFLHSQIFSLANISGAQKRAHSDYFSDNQNYSLKWKDHKDLTQKTWVHLTSQHSTVCHLKLR